MKKISVVAILLALILAALPAIAETSVAFGSYTLTIPDSMESLDLTTDDLEAGLTDCFDNDEFELQLYAYDCEGESLSEYLDDCVYSYTPTDSGINEVNGVSMAYYYFTDTDEDDGSSYTVVCYAIDDDNIIYEAVFFIPSDDNAGAASADAAAIMETIA